MLSIRYCLKFLKNHLFALFAGILKKDGTSVSWSRVTVVNADFRDLMIYKLNI